MTRTMYDSTTAADIPAGSQLVMGYVDGSSAWVAADWQRFPGQVLVRICIFTDRWDAQVIDCEPGNNDAKGILPWIRGKWLRGTTPTVYCFSDKGPARYRISDVRGECDAAGVKRPLFLVSDDDGDPLTFDPAGDPEIIGKQYANSDRTGGHYDASVVADQWPGVDLEVSVDHPHPEYIGESPAVVVLKTDEVGHLRASFRWPDGRERVVERKVYGHSAKMAAYMIYPPVDPDNDPTEDIDAQPGVFIVAIETA